MVPCPSFKDLERPSLVSCLHQQQPHLHADLPSFHSVYIPLLESGGEDAGRGCQLESGLPLVSHIFLFLYTFLWMRPYLPFQRRLFSLLLKARVCFPGSPPFFLMNGHSVGVSVPSGLPSLCFQTQLYLGE